MVSNFTGEKLLVQTRLNHCSRHSTETSEVSDGSYRFPSILFKMCIGVMLCAECLGNNSKMYNAIELDSLRYPDKLLSSWQSHESLRTIVITHFLEVETQAPRMSDLHEFIVIGNWDISHIFQHLVQSFLILPCCWN